MWKHLPLTSAVAFAINYIYSIAHTIFFHFYLFRSLPFSFPLPCFLTYDYTSQRLYSFPSRQLKALIKFNYLISLILRLTFSLLFTSQIEMHLAIGEIFESDKCSDSLHLSVSLSTPPRFNIILKRIKFTLRKQDINTL